MARPLAWRSALALMVAGCAGEEVTAPGSCPAYCLGARIESADTVLMNGVHGDSSFRGYVPAYSAVEMEVAGPGGAVESRGLLHFARFANRIQIASSDTSTPPVAQLDSVRFTFSVGRRSQGASLALYRVPLTVDSTTTFDTLTPYFDDSMLVGVVALPVDSVDTLRMVVPGSQLPTFATDSFEAAIGIAVRASAPGFARLGTAELGRGAQMIRYVQIDSASTRVKRSDSKRTTLDSYVWRPLPPPPAGALAVGGAPSARSFLRFSIPSRIVDSSNVVRATLLLLPAEPVWGAAGDTLRIVAHEVSADVGPKSPVLPSAADSGTYAGARALPGSTDTVRLDVTNIMKVWKGDTVHARTMVLEALPEAGTLGEVRFWSSADPTRRPILHITYIPPIGYTGR